VDERGLAFVKVAFGRCVLRAIKGGEVLAEASFNVVENDTWHLLICRISNLSLSVAVLDALGHPLQGLEVRLLDEAGRILASATTDPGGLASFTGLGEGHYTVEVSYGGQLLARRSLMLTRSTRVEVRLGDKAMLMGALVSLPELIASIASAVAALATLLTIWAWERLAGGGKKTL